MKNDIFNLRRFGKYFVSDARSCAANYGMSMAVTIFMGLLTYLIYGFVILALDGEWESADGGFRSFTFLLCMCIMIINMPIKCYGKITDRKDGSSWLMIPVSTFEKCLSMVVMTVVVIPVITMGSYLLIDLIICKIDPSCGTSLFEKVNDMFNLLGNLKVSAEMELTESPAIADFVKQLSSPWLYIDDFAMVSLTFLLGAIFFKSGKSSKTILAVIILSILISMAATPFLTHIIGSFTADLDMDTPENLNNLFNTGLFRHVALIDTINDTFVNAVLLAGIFFRVKTLKH